MKLLESCNIYLVLMRDIHIKKTILVSTVVVVFCIT